MKTSSSIHETQDVHDLQMKTLQSQQTSQNADPDNQTTEYYKTWLLTRTKRSGSDSKSPNVQRETKNPINDSAKDEKRGRIIPKNISLTIQKRDRETRKDRDKLQPIKIEKYQQLCQTEMDATHL